MPVIGELVTLVTARTTPFEKKMGKAGDSTRKFTKETENSAKALRGPFAGALTKAGSFLTGPGGIAAALATTTGALVTFHKKIMEQGEVIDAVGKMASRLDTSAESLFGLQYAASQVGTTTAGLNMGLQAFQKRLGEAAYGTGEAASAYEALGISAKELLAMDMDERFKLVSDALNGLGTQAERSAMAAKLFSDVGKTELLHMLNLGSEGMEKLQQEARELGLVLDDETVKSIEATGDVMDKLNARIDGYIRNIAGEYIPALGAAANDLDAIANKLSPGGGKDRSMLRVAASTAAAGATGVPSLLAKAGINYYRERGKGEVQEARSNIIDQELMKVFAARERQGATPELEQWNPSDALNLEKTSAELTRIRQIEEQILNANAWPGHDYIIRDF